MSGGNAFKQYLENGYYHVYNRGVEKRAIFLDQQDYAVFLSYLKDYLMPKNEQELINMLADENTNYKDKDKIKKLLKLNNFSKDINLLTYCLMPNHFHFLLKQKSAQSIDQFMNSLGTRYTIYFNHKYKRVGALCQGVYKAVLVGSEEQLLYLTKYIHKQALTAENTEKQPCSYFDYLGKRNTGWVHPDEILAYFSKTNPRLSYESFVKSVNDIESIQKLIIED